MRNKILTAIALATTVAAGAFAGYKIATDDELRGRLLRGAQDIVDTSKKKMDVMTEDVAMRTAQVTKNPKINQDWVNHQWENVGFQVPNNYQPFFKGSLSERQNKDPLFLAKKLLNNRSMRIGDRYETAPVAIKQPGLFDVSHETFGLVSPTRSSEP